VSLQVAATAYICRLLHSVHTSVHNFCDNFVQLTISISISISRLKIQIHIYFILGLLCMKYLHVSLLFFITLFIILDFHFYITNIL